MKAILVALKKDIVSSNKYNKDLQNHIRESQEHIVRKNDEHIYHGIILFIKY